MTAIDDSEVIKARQLQEHRDVKWMLIVSIIILWISWPLPYFGYLFFGALRLPFYNLPPHYTAIEVAWYVVNRADTLTFLLTITFAVLYTTGFGKRELWYKLSLYLFTVSMILFIITFLQTLVGFPYR